MAERRLRSALCRSSVRALLALATVALACASNGQSDPAPTAAASQAATPAEEEAAPDVALLSADQLDDLVARVALYPDELLALVLPAATNPLQIVEAQRFLEARKKNTALKPK